MSFIERKICYLSRKLLSNRPRNIKKVERSFSVYQPQVKTPPIICHKLVNLKIVNLTWVKSNHGSFL